MFGVDGATARCPLYVDVESGVDGIPLSAGLLCLFPLSVSCLGWVLSQSMLFSTSSS